MTQGQMFEASFGRPKDYTKLSPEHQWAIDARLGILDWDGSGANGPLTAEEKQRIVNHYTK